MTRYILHADLEFQRLPVSRYDLYDQAVSDAREIAQDPHIVGAYVTCMIEGHPRVVFDAIAEREAPQPEFIDVEYDVERRRIARGSGDYKTGDAIRAHLLARGIVLTDHPDGTTTYQKYVSGFPVSMR